MRQVALLLAGAMACAFLAPAARADTVRIGLAVADDVGASPIVAAEKLGYYKAAGLEVQTSAYRGGGAAQEAMSAGAADIITYFGAGVGLAVSKGAKEKVVASAMPEAFGWHLLVNAKSNYHSVKDLDGKKVGVTVKGSTTDMFALWAAEHNGIKIQTIPLGGGALIPALRNGQVDGIVLWPANTFKELETGDARSVMNIGKEMIPTMAEIYVASDEFIAKHPKELRATLGAIFKALDYMRNNRAWTVAFLKKYSSEDDDKVIADVYTQVIMELPRKGEIRKDWMENSLKLAAPAWDMPELAKIDPASLITDDYHPH